MLIRTVLNRIGDFKPWVIEDVQFGEDTTATTLEVRLRPRANGKAFCSKCMRKCSGYDIQKEQGWEYVPLWGIKTLVFCERRRVQCPEHGVVVEWLPWAEGKRKLTKTFMCFLARWAKRLSIQEVGEVYRTSWRKVFDAVEWAVEWGLEHRDVEGVEAIGVDEIQRRKWHKYLTLVYQIDGKRSRLLWLGKDRTKKCLRSFFEEFGEEWTSKLKFICSDMWGNYLDVIKEKAKSALNVLDRYHLEANMNKAIDKVRAAEAKKLKAEGKDPWLKGTRWIFLKKKANRTEEDSETLKNLLRRNLKTVRSCLLKDELNSKFWEYVSWYHAGRFLDKWCTKVMRSKIEPMKDMAKTLRKHRQLILNWFKARKAGVSLGAVEGTNNKAKVIMRRAYGYRTYRVIRVMLYHGLGDLPAPEIPHAFCC